MSRGGAEGTSHQQRPAAVAVYLGYYSGCTPFTYSWNAEDDSKRRPEAIGLFVKAKARPSTLPSG